MTIPNILSILRLILGPVLIILAWFGLEMVFVGVLIFAFFLDLIDGPIARKLHQVSRLGSRIDSYADFSIYIAFIIGAIFLWPDIVNRELFYFILVCLSITLPALFGLIKFHGGTSYHTLLVKLAAVCMAPAAIILFVGGPPWPFYIATAVSVIAAIEEIVITCLLDKPQSDIKNIIQVLNKRKNRS